MGILTSYFEPTGLAAARIEVRALRVVMMPAFAMETVCCSCTHMKLGVVRGVLYGCTYHNFVKDTTCGIGHLVEFIDTADTAVT